MELGGAERRRDVGRASVARLIARALSVLVTLVGVTIAAFLVLALLPGDPLAALVPADSLARLDDASRDALSRALHLDEPVLVRYAHWLAGIARGDLGVSLRSGRPVGEEIAGRLGATLELNAVALLLAAAVGIPFGWWCARRPGSMADRVGSAALLALYALPFFWLALVLQSLLAVRLGLVPLYGRTPPSGVADLVTRLHHLALPAGALALHALAFYARFARATALSGMSGSSALFARARGLAPGTIFRREGVAPSLVPLATLAGLMVPALVAGSVLVETIFRWPGVGKLFVDAVLQRDVPVVVALTLLSGVLTVLGNSLADAMTALLDPRRRIPAEDARS